jgi:hypothetical protein
MKLAIISSLFASAAAFTPANVGRVSTHVSETKVRLGTLPFQKNTI